MMIFLFKKSNGLFEKFFMIRIDSKISLLPCIFIGVRKINAEITEMQRIVAPTFNFKGLHLLAKLIIS